MTNGTIWGLPVESNLDYDNGGSDETRFKIEGISDKFFATPSQAVFNSEPPKIPAEIKQQWLDALRGTQYKQGQSYLAQWTPDGVGPHYCCLGVLCEVRRVDFVTKTVSDNATISSNVKEYCFDGQRSEVFLPQLFAISIGMEEEHQTLLAGLNDSGWSFGEIADLIEKVF